MGRMMMMTFGDSALLYLPFIVANELSVEC
jgi:hypothetical protein